MSSRQVTIELDPGLWEWAEEGAREAKQSVEVFLAELVAEERARQALESMAAWVREDEGGPTTQEIDVMRARLLDDDADGDGTTPPS